MIDWVMIVQSVLRYNVVIAGKFFNKGSWVSDVWRKEHPEEFAEECDVPPERMATSEERKGPLHLDHDHRGVCAAFGHATSTWRWPTSAERGNSNLYNARTNQATSFRFGGFAFENKCVP